MAQRFGGSFAPALTDSLLADYTALIEALGPSPLRDALRILLNCCNKWWEQPESAGTSVRAHPSVSCKSRIMAYSASNFRLL